MPDPVGNGERRWVSDCCAAEMTTAGGDDDWGSSCWAVCGECGEPCDPVAPAVVLRKET